MRTRPWIIGALLVAGQSTLTAGCGYDGSWDLAAGYRHDEFDWSVQGTLGVPDVLAEINWEDQHMFEVATRYILTGWDSIYLRTQGSLAWIIQAEPVYSVYGESHRQDLLVRERTCKVGRLAYDLKGGLGFHILCYKGKFDIAPIAGWNYARQFYRYRDPRVTDFPDTDFLCCFDDLRVRYRPVWNGGFVGVDNIWRICNWLTINLTAEAHFAAYRARGNWDWEEPQYLVPEHQNREYFIQRWHDCANGWGKLIQGSLVYCACNGWNIGVIAGYQSWRTRPGQHIIDYVGSNFNSDLDLIVNLPSEGNCVLNPIHWRSYWYWFTLQCQF